VAVPNSNSSRLKGLVWAANLTSIDITIPERLVWTSSDLENIKPEDGSPIAEESAMALMGHLNALEWSVIVRFDMHTTM
jgi:hypothetical protein